MDSTCLPAEIQCTQEVVDSLQGSHFQFRFVDSNLFRLDHYFNANRCFFDHYRCRGQIKVKGKGDMITYFLADPPNPGQYNVCREYQGKNSIILEIMYFYDFQVISLLLYFLLISS